MKKTIIALLCSIPVAPAVAGLPTGLSGAWYNPAQSGHGIHLQMLSTEHAIGVWNVYDREGNPLHLYLEGHVAGGRLQLDAYAPRGMKFGSFDRSNYNAPRWGTLQIDFDDCDHATLAYDGTGPAGAGFGQGTLPLERLTTIAGTTCSLDARQENALAGAYDASWTWPGPPFTDAAFRPHAAVDAQGRLWVTSAWTPGPTYLRAVSYSPLLLGSAPSEGRQAVTGLYNMALATGHTVAPTAPLALTATFETASNGTVTAHIGDAAPMFSQFTATRAPGTNVLDDADFAVSSLDGRRYRFTTVGQFFEFTRVVEFGRKGSGHVCIVSLTMPSQCEFEGHVTGVDPGLSMFDFTIGVIGAHSSFQGKGWIRQDTGALVMLAADQERGFGFVALPQ